MLMQEALVGVRAAEKDKLSVTSKFPFPRCFLKSDNSLPICDKVLEELEWLLFPIVYNTNMTTDEGNLHLVLGCLANVLHAVSGVQQ